VNARYRANTLFIATPVMSLHTRLMSERYIVRGHLVSDAPRTISDILPPPR
jgi:hypothetical protein